MDPTQNPGYVDAGYLAAVAQTAARIKEISFERMGAAPGMRVLDVGCGPATDTLALGERVGRAGAVHGVDYDPAMVAEAERRAADAGLAGRVAHRVADACALPFGDGAFDAVRCERLFQHLPDADAALREMVRVTRPGGRVVAVDTDFGTLSIDSADPARERRMVGALARHALLNAYSGRRLPGQFRRARVAEVRVETHPFHSTSYGAARAVLNFAKMEEAALRGGAASAEEVAGWRREMEEADAAGAFFCSVAVVLVYGEAA